MGAVHASRPPFARLRRVILVVLFASLAGLAGLYLLGRPSGPPQEEWRADGTRAREGRSGEESRASHPLAESEGFEYERRVGERSALRLRGAHFTRERDDMIRLEEVELELTREDGDVYQIRSERALYDSNHGGAELTGAVRLTWGRGFGVTADRLDLVEGGRVVVSKGPVGLELGRGLSGRAGGLRFDSEADRVVLRGQVHAAGRRNGAGQPLALDAEEVLIDRKGEVVRATGGTFLSVGKDRLRSRELELSFDEESGSPRRAVARRDVAGGISTVRTPAGEAAGRESEEAPGRIRFEGAVATVDFVAGTSRPEALHLEGSPAKVSFHDPQNGVRHLQAPTVVATFLEGRPHDAIASGGVLVREPAPAGRKGAREVRSDDARASFGADGELSALTLDGHVSLAGPDLTATGERAELEARSGAAVLLGKREPAHARSARGELWAPRIEVARETGTARALGGVRANLEDDAAGIRLGPKGSGDREPIRVRAREAVWNDRSTTWAFQGAVEAVQGENLLFADELSGSTAGGETTASGDVRTIWKDAGSGAPSTTTSVSATTVVYFEVRGVIEYRGGVRVRQEQRELEADQLRIELDEAQKARRMEATGSVRLTDRATGRVVTGVSALHDLVAETILIAGEPVILTEEGGATIRGRRLLYDIEHGTARMLAEGEEV